MKVRRGAGNSLPITKPAESFSVRRGLRFGAILIAAGLAAAIALPSAASAATTSWQVVASYSGGLNVPSDTWVDHSTDLMYVTEFTSDDVAVYDLATDTVVQRISVGSQPKRLTYNPATQKLYVGLAGTAAVSVISVAPGAGYNTVVDTISFAASGGVGPSGTIGIDLSTGTLYVPVVGASCSDQRLYVIDGSTDAIIAQISGDTCGQYGIAVDSATHTIYVASQNSNSIAVYDGATDTFTGNISLGATSHQPQGVAFDSGNGLLYVGNALVDSVTVVNPGTSSVVADVATPGSVGAPSVDPITGTVFAPNSNEITVIDAASNAVTQHIPLGGASFFTTWDATDHSDYVGAFGAGNVQRIAQGTSPTITTAALPNTTTGASYSQTIAATGTAPITFAVTAGALPAGLTLNLSTGAITGTPTGSGPSTFTITATNLFGTDAKQYTITVSAPVGPTITTTSLPSGVVGATYASSVAATGTSIITFSVTAGTLPAGLSLDPASGAITGTPTASGQFTFTISATNRVGTDSRSFTIAVSAATTPAASGASTGTTHLAYTGITEPWWPLAVAVAVAIAGLVAIVASRFVLRPRRRS